MPASNSNQPFIRPSELLEKQVERELQEALKCKEQDAVMGDVAIIRAVGKVLDCLIPLERWPVRK